MLRSTFSRAHILTTAATCVLLICACGSKSGDYKGATRYEVAGHEQIVLPGARGAPLLVFLHGRGADPGDVANSHVVAALQRLGRGAPSVVIPDGGGSSYWHDRRTGRWGSCVR